VQMLVFVTWLPWFGPFRNMARNSDFHPRIKTIQRPFRYHA